MEKKIYTYGLLIILMVLLAVSASYMLPDPTQVDQMIKESNEPQSGVPQNYRPGGRGGPVRTISSKNRKKPVTRPAPETRQSPETQSPDSH